MKNILILLAIFSMIACKNETKTLDYVSLSGKITNPNSKELQVVDKKNVTIKTITLNEDGSFKDTLKVSKEMYALTDGNEYAALFLANGYNLNIILDTREFDESLKVTGEGSEGSNYLAEKMLLQEKTFTNINDLYALEKEEFTSAINEKKVAFTDLKNSYKNLDSSLIATDTKDTKMLFEFIIARYDKVANLYKLKGSPSPKFVNYENYKGGTTSLDDFKGKYVYVDVWATWCGPCKAEIPFLKELEKEFHGKNIVFVSVSVDKKDAHETWKKMIAEKEMGGVQLFADNDWNSQFVKDYGIEGIPRFLLIDDKGNVLNPDAPRPSNPNLKAVLNGLLK